MPGSAGHRAPVPKAMDARPCFLALDDLLAAPTAHQQSYAEVLRVEALSVGVYELASGSKDAQDPHTEDEVYIVLRGQAQATVADEKFAVRPGSFLYVPARVPHRFHEIEGDLALLVLFAPAEGTALTRRRGEPPAG